MVEWESKCYHQLLSVGRNLHDNKDKQLDWLRWPRCPVLPLCAPLNIKISSFFCCLIMKNLSANCGSLLYFLRFSKPLKIFCHFCHVGDRARTFPWECCSLLAIGVWFLTGSARLPYAATKQIISMLFSFSTAKKKKATEDFLVHNFGTRSSCFTFFPKRLRTEGSTAALKHSPTIDGSKWSNLLKKNVEDW